MTQSQGIIFTNWQRINVKQPNLWLWSQQTATFNTQMLNTQSPLRKGTQLQPSTSRGIKLQYLQLNPFCNFQSYQVSRLHCIGCQWTTPSDNSHARCEPTTWGRLQVQLSSYRQHSSVKGSAVNLVSSTAKRQAILFSGHFHDIPMSTSLFTWQATCGISYRKVVPSTSQLSANATLHQYKRNARRNTMFSLLSSMLHIILGIEKALNQRIYFNSFIFLLCHFSG